MLKKTVQRNGNYITYTYDVLGDLLTEAAYNSANASLGSIVNTYDAMGRTLTRTYGGNTDRYTYTNGQTATAITNGTVEKTYGRNGNALTYTLKDGAGNLADKVSYTYDNALRLAGVTDYSAHNGTTALYTVSYTYDANGNRAREVSTAGTEVYYLYNEAGLVTSVMNYAGSSGGSPVATEAYTYSYYTDGNQRTKQDSVTGKKTTYVYDAAGRLTSETESVNGTVTQTYAYTYDASGNRLTLTASGNEAYSVAYTYDKANRLLTETKTVSGVATVKTYTYDLNGNLLTVSESSTVTESYTYDPFGKMLSYTKSGTTTAYTYRPDGMLYTKQTGSNASTKKTYISSDGQIVFEQTGTDNVGAVVYSYGLTRISAKSRTALTAAQTVRYYYLYNAHGDVVRIISGTNVTVKTYDYDAFGNDRSAVAGDTNPFRYCGEYFDTATETYFLRARWYDPATGRFTQQDAWEYYNTEDPLSLNLYVYCFGNPVRYVDPSGNIPWLAVLGLVALGGFVMANFTSCSTASDDDPALPESHSPEYFLTAEEAIDMALKTTYAKAVVRGHDKEYGCLVYSAPLYSDSNEMYYWLERKEGHYSRRTGDEAIHLGPSKKLQFEVENGRAVLIAAVHTHPRYAPFSAKDTIITTDNKEKGGWSIPVYLILSDRYEYKDGKFVPCDGRAYMFGVGVDRNTFDDLDPLPMRIVKYDRTLAYD